MANVTLRRSMNNLGFFFKKNAPAIMTGVGVTATVAAVGLVAYKSYKELPDIVKEHKADLEAARTDVDPDTAKKQSLKVYGKTAGKLLKAYAIPAALLAGGITSIIKSDHVQTKRFNEVSAALALTGAAYDELKKRVANEIGEEALNDILNGAVPKDKKTKEFTETDEDGVVTVDKCKASDGTHHSIYAVCFDEANPNWRKEFYYNQWFIERVENMVNDQLVVKGRLFLADILSQLGFSETNGNLTRAQALAAQVVGYEYDPKHPDKRIKFNIETGYYDKDSVERSCWIDFDNVDGELYSRLYENLYVKD